MSFVHTIDPVMVTIGPISIRWYGLIYFLGFLCGYLYLSWRIKHKKIDLTELQLQDFMLYMLVGVVAGARLFYIIFYNPQHYLNYPLDVLAVWKGGLSFHGGLTGALVAGWLFCRRHEKSFLKLADECTVPVTFGLALGRIGNFLNGELVGRVTNVPWCVYFQGFEGCRHPSQLYESAKNLFMFFVLFSVRDKKLPPGFRVFGFLFMYAVLRFFIEFTRAPDSQLGLLLLGLTMGQWLNVGMAVIAGIFMWVLARKR